MNLKLQKSLKQYGAIFEERQNLIPATIGTADEFGQVDVLGKENYVYVRIQSGEIAQAYNTKVVALAGLRVWCGYEKTRPGLLQVLDVRNIYGAEYQQKIPAHAKTHEYGGYDQVFVRGEQFIPKLVSKYSGMTVRVQAGAIYTDDFGWYWHRPQDVSLIPYIPVSGAHWALIEISHSGSLIVTVGSGTTDKALLFEYLIPRPHTNAQPVAAVALYQGQSGVSATKYGGNDILDLRWYQAIATGTAGGGIPEAPIDGEAYGRKDGAWVIVSGSAGMSEAPMDGLQYGRQSGSWTEVSGTGWVGATAYSALTDVRISGTMTNGNTPVWIAASGAWYPMPTWEDAKDPTGWIYCDDIVSYYDNSARTIYLSGTLQYYWHGIKRILGDGVTWTSSAHSGTDYSTYYLYSNDGITFDWKSTPWVFDNIMVALVKRRGSVMFGTREHHGLMPWQVHEALHSSISSFLKSGGTPIAGSYSTSASDASTCPIFAAALIEDEDLESNIPQTTSGTYTTLRVSGTTAIFQVGQSFPFRATGSFMLINNPTTGAETPTSHNQFQNIYQIMTPMTADVESQKYTTVFLQPQRTFTSQTAAESEIVEILQLGDFKSLFAESVMYTRICYNTRNTNGNAGKCQIASITYVSKYGAGAGASSVPPADYVLSGTDYNMPASVGVATEYARADHLHGTPPSGTFQAPLAFPLAANLGGTGIANAVGSTLTLGGATSITTGGTIALGGFTLTVPATGIAALLATKNVFTVQQMVDGTADEIQLRVQANGTQTAQVLTVEANGGAAYFNVGWDGRVRMGGGNYANTNQCLQVAYGTNTSGAKSAIYSEISDLGAATSSYGFNNNTSVNALVNKTGGNIYGTFCAVIFNNIPSGTSVGTGVVSAAVGGRVYANPLMAGSVNWCAVYYSDLWGLAPSGNPAGVITNLYGVKLESPSTTSTGGGSVTNIYGIRLENVVGGTALNYAIYTNAGLVRFGDQLSIVGVADRQQLIVTGFTTQAVATPVAQITRNDVTAGISAMLGLTALGSGAIGDGGSILLNGKSSTTAAQAMGLISWSWVDPTHAAKKAKLSFSAYDTVVRLGIEIEASGTAAKLGFFGHATAVQPSAYTPTNVSADRSYDANATTVDELADVLGTLIADLQSLGLVG